ncbi:Aste57867_1282 [Aphanomyces stellatus]|uniref:5-hydroxyisourate hydrolase n=1 Tax=Aphanomyces stellatus TaxID=120398 RepID=A0A485K914_9STRA|nr:hypothetical protein As57867_001281 [Aphanomyces stellatus]VFT78501.1 Aste57867_1282 [Aphanomyces stellatus]
MERLQTIQSHMAAAAQPPVTSHVLDTAIGAPAANIMVRLERQTANGGWEVVGAVKTNADGRVPGLSTVGQDLRGLCRLTFETAAYFEARGIREYFYPEVVLTFRLTTTDHYHVPLLLAPFGFSTYRGS